MDEILKSRKCEITTPKYIAVLENTVSEKMLVQDQ